MCKISPVGKKRNRSISLEMLRKFVELGDRIFPWSEFILVAALLVTTMRCMARGGEISALDADDVEFVDNGMRIRFKRTKNSNKGRLVFIERSGTATCPVHLLERFMEWRRLDDSFNGITKLFGNVNTNRITNWLRIIAKQLGFAGEFSSHSLRIGGASQAVLAGFSREMIMLLGDWNSDAVDRYLKSGVQTDRNISSQMGF